MCYNKQYTIGRAIVKGNMRCISALGWHAGFDPAAKSVDLFLGPLAIARHGAVCKSLEDVPCMRADIVVVPKVEGELH